MDLQQLHKLYIERLEAVSGKPVILQCDPKFSGHATIKIATKEQPAHVLLYKPEQKERMLNEATTAARGRLYPDSYK